MRILFIVLATVLFSSCAELHERALGTRVNSFNVKGIDYVHCSILVDKAQPQMVDHALELCRDGIQGGPVPATRH